MFFLDDLSLSLLILSIFRFFAAMIFMEDAVGKRDLTAFFLPLGWIIYGLGSLAGLRSYVLSGNANHIMFGFFITLGTFFLIISLIQSFTNPSMKIISSLFVCISIILITGSVLSPETISWLSVTGQLLIIVITFVIILIKRKWIVKTGGLSSLIWLSVFFIMSLFSILIHLVFPDLQLSQRLTLTFITNLFLFMSFLHFNREQRIRLLKKSRLQISESLKEKEIMLKEIHHRVKNNMTIMDSLLSLQSTGFKDPDLIEQFVKARNRIESMALVHEKLYESTSLSNISFYEYVDALIEKIKVSFENEIILIKNISDFEMSPDILIPCGLILNEVITNIIKHADCGNAEKQITVSASLSETGYIILSIKDNGRGYPENFNPEQTTGLGFQLISSLTDQIDAEMTIKNNEGGEITFLIPTGRKQPEKSVRSVHQI